MVLMKDDRHDAQPCYCGEPNCVGFIGGKTQTAIAAMDELCLGGASLLPLYPFLPSLHRFVHGELINVLCHPSGAAALGITDEVERLGLKGSKKKKGKKKDGKSVKGEKKAVVEGANSTGVDARALTPDSAASSRPQSRQARVEEVPEDS